MFYSKSFIRWLTHLNKVNAVVLLCFLLTATLQIFYWNNHQSTERQMNSYSQRAYSPSSISITDVEKQYRKRFNLMIDGYPETVKECTLDFVNRHKLPQDHPCVIDLIRREFTNPPVSREVPYQLDDAIKAEPFINELEIKQLLRNKTKGFFVECGAYDGQKWSNTLNMEMDLDWTGLLIEGNPVNYKKLLSRKRKAWTFPMCLSLAPYPTKVNFVDWDGERNSGSLHIVETDEDGNKKYDEFWDQFEGQVDNPTIEVQCFPFYSVLLASNRTTIDYFSLDVEGFEIKILKTIPWDKVDIKTMRVEFLKTPALGNLSSEQVLTEYMEGEPGYIKLTTNNLDGIYFKDYMNNHE